jgi:hypothetical protein
LAFSATLSQNARLSGELLVQGDSKIDQIFFLSDLPFVDEEFQGRVCMLEGENGVETFVRVDLEAVLLVPPNGSSHDSDSDVYSLVLFVH